MRRRFDDALVALGRLDAVTAHLPNASLLLYSFVRKEAVLSSQIEGTQSSLADLLLYEIDEQPGVPVEDAREVSRCVAALEHGLKQLRGGLAAVARACSAKCTRCCWRIRGGRGKTPGRGAPLAGLDRRHAARQRGVRAAAGRRSWPSAWHRSSASSTTSPSRRRR